MRCVIFVALTCSWEDFGGAASSPMVSCLTDIDSAHIQRSRAVLVVVVKGVQGEGGEGRGRGGGAGGGGGEGMRKRTGRRSGRREREESHGDTYLHIHAYGERRLVSEEQNRAEDVIEVTSGLPQHT